MSAPRLVPATLQFENGVPYAAQFGDVYHSADGGLAQARHVFLSGNRLPQRWHGRERFTILETGFGIGLNFLATWQAWHGDTERCAQLHYVAIEKHPFHADDLAQLHALWPELAELSAPLRAAWPVLMPGFHRVLLEQGRIVLTLVFGDIADCLPQIEAAADAFYLDGFAPGKNPEMWAPPILARLNRIAAPAASFATYTVSAAVRRALTQAGFLCEKLPGFGRKREMLAGRFAPRWEIAGHVPVRERHAIVIGAGVAGCAACERLAARGWRVTLIERHAQPAQEASGNPAGIVMPLPSRDDNQVSRVARAAYLFALRYWQHLGGIGQAFAGEACGVLQLAADKQEAAMQEAIAAVSDPAFLRRLDAAEVRQSLGLQAAHGGWLFERGGWLTPASLCAAMLDACGARLQRRFETAALRLARVEDQWQVTTTSGAPVATAPVVILANGAQALAFNEARQLPLATMRGQVTYVPAGRLPKVPLVICGDGYVTRPVQGICCVGASYDADDDPRLRIASQQENLARLAQLLPGSLALDDLPLDGRVGFRCVTPDRLPLAGPLPDAAAPINGSRLRDVPRLPGLYGLLGYGSRGITWAPLLAELVAAQLEGEALPLERALKEALDPARFVLKAYRRGHR
jgi:tRNA 5-methylaminomethyl-2-thiouridine biosynthesis bifunctional protein